MSASARAGASSTFGNQSRLPRLVVPPLAQTVERYVRSVAPLQDAQTHAHTAQAAQRFADSSGLGPVLQQRLLAHDRTQPHSWLETWWLHAAYHAWRESLLVNSNWFLLLADPVLPGAVTGPDSVSDSRPFTAAQIDRAAGIISNLLDYKDLIDNEKIPPEYAKDTPLCMHQYQLLFGICRVPKPSCDINVGSHPCSARHITLSIRDQVFSLIVYDQSGARLPISAIKKLLWDTVSQLQNCEMQPPIGLLTAEHRDTWAKVHRWLELYPKNLVSLKEIEDSLFHLCLDDVECLTVDDLAKNVFHGHGARNRWFDKALQFIVSSDGKAGLNGEHSPCDALIPAYMVEYLAANEPAKDPVNAVKEYTLSPPKHLTWHIDPEISSALTKAEKYAHDIIKDSDLSVLLFDEYGTDFIKSTAKVSPDAYSQMCLQLAFYRLHNKFPPTYETASTRQYLHGRTETCRSLSTASVAFVHAFTNPNLTATEKYEKFKAACVSHVEYISAAARGYGVDRHLFGLRMCMKPDERAEIFDDEVFKRSSTFLLSTSNLFPGKHLQVAGFGAVDREGYGTNYMLLPGMIKYGIESKKSGKETSTKKFKYELIRVLRDMKEMCEAANGGRGVAKL